MSLNRAQFKDLIERVLGELDPKFNSPAAVNLLLGTAAQESFFGKYIRQIRGPALGVFQIEPETFKWLKQKYKGEYPILRSYTAKQLEWDLRAGIIFARLRYWVVPDPLPEPDDVEGLGEYWNDFYNANPHKGTVEEFKKRYEQFVT